MDSVMPKTNKRLKYGEFRRIILNFIEASSKAQIDEENTKWLLPESSHNHSWWRQAGVARDMGRTAFRIHGTGWVNFNGSSPHYPFVPGIGCIVQRENRHRTTTFVDQRLLLDQLMLSSRLDPTPDNEFRIRGLLYVIEIDDKAEPVHLRELTEMGL